MKLGKMVKKASEMNEMLQTVLKPYFLEASQED